MAAQVHVKSFFGSSDSWGKIEAVVGMETDYGRLSTISGNLLEVGSGVSQTHTWMLDEYVSIASGHAMNTYDWPTGVRCFPINRHITNPLGQVFNVYSTSGHTYYTGSQAISYGR